MATLDRWRRIGTTAFILLSLSRVLASGDEPLLTLSSTEFLPEAREVRFRLNALNTTGAAQSWTPPPEIQCTLRTSDRAIETVARASATNAREIVPGGFASETYAFRLPDGWSGTLVLEPAAVPGSILRLDVAPPVQPPVADAPEKAPRGVVYFLKGRAHAATAGEYDPDTFFKQHISGHEPLYFIAGTESPNAKFQISFKYRLLNEQGWLARKAPLLRGFHLAYSQTSLWDWNSPSAPFFDSSYRPELLYSWEEVFGGPTNGFSIDLQGGVQHESNGRDGGDSKSLNVVYFRPRFTLGSDAGLQLTLMPRVWAYVGDLSDNPDIADYRGYADLRTILGWKRGLQVSALGRIGERLSQGSVTVDVTYPLMQPPAGSFSLYLHAQYFTGYGESLLGYRERTDIFRAGISLYR